MSKRRILVIDDEPGVTKLVKLNLERTGQYEVRAENDPRAGLAAAREFQPDLILLDVVMPQMDGGDLVAQIRSDQRLQDTPIVFLTAVLAREETGGGEIVSGGMRFLAKPVKLKELVACIEQSLGA
jgi:two-component system OmpR family response regulator